MSSYAKMASINRLVADTQKEKSRIESLGKIRRSPPREDHYRSSMNEEPTPTFDVEKLLSSPQYEDQEDLDRIVIITDPDEAAAILNGGNTYDQAGNPPTLPRSEGNQDSSGAKGPLQGETPLPKKPRNSPGLNKLGHIRPQSNPQLMSGPQWSRVIGEHIVWSPPKLHSRSP